MTTSPTRRKLTPEGQRISQIAWSETPAAAWLSSYWRSTSQGASIRAMVEPTGHSYGFIRDLLQAPRTHPLSKPVLEEHADRCDLTVDHASKRGLPATPQQLGSCRSSQWWR